MQRSAPIPRNLSEHPTELGNLCQSFQISLKIIRISKTPANSLERAWTLPLASSRWLWLALAGCGWLWLALTGSGWLWLPLKGCPAPTLRYGTNELPRPGPSPDPAQIRPRSGPSPDPAQIRPRSGSDPARPNLAQIQPRFRSGQNLAQVQRRPRSGPGPDPAQVFEI